MWLRKLRVLINQCAINRTWPLQYIDTQYEQQILRDGDISSVVDIGTFHRGLIRPTMYAVVYFIWTAY